ncbi:hypothetical protein BS78_01G146500 [Paspalum vaginatum]|nr:hypothetical protein BS78_01G146500 [Paspalum vaginatum]
METTTATAAAIQDEEEEDATAPAPWADMATDCLVHVFAHLDLEDLLASAPLVCRGWRLAAADPSLWRVLDLRRDHLARFTPWSPLAAAFARRYGVRRFTAAGLLALCAARARDVALPPLLDAPADALARARCPALRRLALPAPDDARLPGLVARWPLLEHLELDAKPAGAAFPALAAQLARHCRGFVSLRTSGAVTAEDAEALARCLPGLRALCLDGSYLPRDHLLTVLDGCRGLREFSARGCVGFDEKDGEVLARGARIPRFDVAGSTLALDDHDDQLAGAGGGFCDSSAYVDVM